MALSKGARSALNFTILFVAGIFFLISSVFIYNYILRGVFGNYAFTQSSFSLESFSAIFTPAPVTKVGVFYSKKTENMLPAGSTWIADNIAAWERFVSGNKMLFQLVTEEDLEAGKYIDLNVLILPSAKSLSDKEIVVIKKYINEGGSVIATSGTASFSADGKWRGWQFLKEVFGVTFTKELPKQVDIRYLTMRGGNPLTSEIPTGYRMKIANWDLGVAVQVLDPRTTQVGFWYDFRRDSGLVAEEIYKTGGVTYGTFGKGRFVWWGFDIISMVGTSEDYGFIDKFVRNSLYWTTYKPLGNLSDWPGNFKSAAIILTVVGDQPENVRNLLPILRSSNLKTTFLVSSEIAESNSGLIKSLGALGDFAAVVDIGYMESVNDTVNKLTNLETQTNDVQNALSTIKNSTGETIAGIKPQYGLFNDATLMAAASSQIKYIITDSLTDRSVPKYVVKGENPMLVITKTVRDDIEIIKNYGLEDRDFQFFTYQEDIDRIIYEGGLYVFLLHTEYQLQPENVETIKDVIGYLKEKNVLLLSLPELFNWWANKNKVEVRIDARGTNRLVVAMSNTGTAIMKELIVPVDFQLDITKFTVSTEIIGTPLPKYDYNKSNRQLLMRVTDLKPNESRIYYVDYETPKI